MQRMLKERIFLKKDSSALMITPFEKKLLTNYLTVPIKDQMLIFLFFFLRKQLFLKINNHQ